MLSGKNYLYKSSKLLEKVHCISHCVSSSLWFSVLCNKVTMETSSSFVNDGMLLILQGNLSATNKQDVQNSLLVSQLAADNKFNRHDQTGDWYHTFSTTLGKIGWVIENNDFALNQPTPPTFNLVSLALNEASRVSIAKKDMQTFRKMANVLQQLPSDLVKILYRGREDTTMGANLLMAVGSVTEHNNVVVQLYSTSIVSSDTGNQKYFSHVYDSQSVHFNKNVILCKLVQSTDQYSSVRQGHYRKTWNNTFYND